MGYRLLSLVLTLGLGVFAGCAADSLPAPGADGPPCGIAACSADDPDTDFPDYIEAGGGKADAEGVESEIAARVTDGVFDADDVRAAFEATGRRVGRGEILVIRDALESAAYEVTPEAVETALAMAANANLFDYEVEYLEDAGLSYGGSEIPDAVRELVARARLNGAVAYDVREQDDDGEGVWNPYPAITPPVENMTFEHTEVTPSKLAADVADVDLVFNRIAGTETAEYCDPSGGCRDYQRITYDEGVGGTGNIAAQYDEVRHEDIYARGSAGQVWASNCAILSDGSVHCLPAARRSVLQNVILTNPHLSRCNPYQGFETGCRNMLYHGHITARGGVITSIEVSGRLSKRVAKGRVNLIDPLAVLEAWGFEIAPGVSVRYGNTEDGSPVRDLEGGVLLAPEDNP